MDAMQTLLQIKEKQGWKEKALLRLIINWMRAVDLHNLVEHIKTVADEDNARLQALNNSQDLININKEPQQ